jgi:hypothetical protein
MKRYMERDVHWIPPFPSDVFFFLVTALEADFCARGGKRCTQDPGQDLSLV